MAQIRGILFDIDGTLIDSNDSHAHSWVEAFTEHGYSVPFETVRHLIGTGGDKVLPETIHIEKDSPEGKKIAARRKEIFKAKFQPDLKPFPSAHDLLMRLHQDGYRLVIATSGEQDEADASLELLKAKHIIDVVTTQADAKKSKPDPDIIQSALTKSGLLPQTVLMIGDTPYDVDAAGKAGVRTIAVRCGGWHDKDFMGAAAVYDDPAALLSSYPQWLD